MDWTVILEVRMVRMMTENKNIGRGETRSKRWVTRQPSWPGAGVRCHQSTLIWTHCLHQIQQSHMATIIVVTNYWSAAEIVIFLTRIYNYYHFVIDSFNVIQVFQWFLPHALVLVPWSWQFMHITVDNIEDDNTDITNLQTIKLVVVMMMMARSLLLWIHVQQN